MTTNKVFDIPIIARGKIIMPGDDAIEFGGRVGARFRCPDPNLYINEMLLSNGSALEDLYNTPTEEILDFLAALGPRLGLDNPYMKEAFDLCQEAGDLPESILLPVYSVAQDLFSREKLAQQVDAQIGIDYLDGWVEQGQPGKSNTRIRAVGTRQVHVIAGNVPITAALTVIRTALSKSDSLIKLPSNDPLTTSAIVRTMIDMAPDHPVTRHMAVAYWKGGDEQLERQIFTPTRVERITAWGGMSSMTHIQKYLVPGIELIPMNPKFSISIVGREALENEAVMEDVAMGIAIQAGQMNQVACASTRVVYVECNDSDDQLNKLDQLGEKIFHSWAKLSPSISTPAKRSNPELEAEMEALALDDTFYTVHGDTINGGVVVSKLPEAVEFASLLANRVVNLVPLPDIETVARHVDEGTQTVGIFPQRLRFQLRDKLTLNGVQRMIPLGISSMCEDNDPAEMRRMPHDGGEPLRRSVRWIVDEGPANG